MKNLSNTKLVLIFFCVLFLNSIFFPIIINIFNIEPLATPNYFDDFNIQNIIILVAFGPLIETGLFQYLMYIIISKVNISYRYYLIISTIFFSLWHWYNFQYVLKELISGFLYAVLFYRLIILNRKKEELAVFYTFLTHALHNGCGLILDFLTTR